MRLILTLAASLLVFMCTGQPIALHPDNPHYLTFKNEPALLITSAEHYGAVLNRDFDYQAYLQTLSEEGMNYTRIFTGSYVEVPGAFGIQKNTLAPAAGAFLGPWLRSDDNALFTGETKFDLDRWNPAYFERLHDFMAEAARYDIIVEVTFFCATYQDANWERHPFNPANNVQGVGPANRRDFNTLKDPATVDYQLKLVKKLVAELNDYDNLIFELSNEPWADNGVKVQPMLKTLHPQKEGMNWALWSEAASPETLQWQETIAAAIADAESNLPKKHLIAQNYVNFQASLPRIDSNISILNFHYAWPEAVDLNYGWNLPVNFDESGFHGQADSTYLEQAWTFILAGGAIFNNLDYSFFVGREDGLGQNDAPGGGSRKLRKQLKFLRDFMESFDFIRMYPDFNTVKHAPGLRHRVLAGPAGQYAICLMGQPQGSLQLSLPVGSYDYSWIDPQDGVTLSRGVLESSGKTTGIYFDHVNYLLALDIRRRG